MTTTMVGHRLKTNFFISEFFLAVFISLSKFQEDITIKYTEKYMLDKYPGNIK